ncbi:hypothetical protein [Nocardia sp. NPDC004750]
MIEWDVTSRRALVILEDVLDTPIAYALDCVRDQVRERVGDEVDHWIRYSTANRFRDTQAWRQPSSNPIGLYVHELRYVNSKVRLTGGLEGTFTAHIEEDVDDREWWEPHTTSRYADFDFTGEFSATFSREGITDASVYVSEPTENQWQYLDGDEDGVVAADSGEHRPHPRRRRGAGETSTTTTSRPSSRIAATTSGSEPGSGMCASRARFPLRRPPAYVNFVVMEPLRVRVRPMNRLPYSQIGGVSCSGVTQNPVPGWASRFVFRRKRGISHEGSQ